MCWTVGTGFLILLLPKGQPAVFALGVFLSAALYGLCELGRASSRYDEAALIAAVAMIGRGIAVILLAHYSMADPGHPPGQQLLVMAILTALFLWVSWSAARAPEPASTRRPSSPPERPVSAPTSLMR